MAQHKCITQLLKNVYTARPTTDNLTIDSRLNNYSFRLKNTHSARCATSFIYPFPAYAAEPFGGPWSSDSALLHTRLLLTRWLLTYYYILVPWTTLWWIFWLRNLSSDFKLHEFGLNWHETWIVVSKNSPTNKKISPRGLGRIFRISIRNVESKARGVEGSHKSKGVARVQRLKRPRTRT